MNKLTKQQIKDITYDGKILESDGRISGFVNKKTLIVWVPIDNIYYTNDLDYCDKWFAKRNKITVQELKILRLEDKEKINNYFKK